MFHIAGGILLACSWILMLPAVLALACMGGWFLLRVLGILLGTFLVFWLLHKLGAYPVIALTLLGGLAMFIVWDQRQFKVP